MKLKTICWLLFLVAASPSVAQTDPSVFEEPKFRFIGPDGLE